ncbi:MULTISPECIES: MFS transporter [Halocynthiibacter]|uniref:MFS transporter n=1 Tax=Halocynthiibacter halioticoli TaxID=2986804 RepID=A0AAE3J200_9RHOB|nr:MULTISPECIES: MFS transporter [Halocynthiibacter]MCV6825305.1 MFS transporter [Halocynthiibacter halioticoli]MCW4058306.1 MFS transporter [Halocynthiibacter sp. SDUM655004]
MKKFPFKDIDQLPVWRRPVALLVLASIAVPIAFSTWLALLNNFVIEVAGFDGADIGLLHTIREIPGFLAIGVAAVLLIMREQVLAMVSLLLLIVATAVTGFFPSLGGILLVTFISSVGFHYFETVNHSLQLQWLPKDKAPQILGWLAAVGSVATLVAYVAIVMTWERFGLQYTEVFLISGGVAAVIALYCVFAFPQFESDVVQRKSIVLRRRYWLYYALEFLAGARRQIFVVFAGFMMVEKYGFAVHEITALYLVNLIANIVLAPLAGKAIAHFGERTALVFEYAGLALVFFAYAGLYVYGWGVWLAMALYIVDHMLFALRMALKTYFQKIANPADIATSAAVTFTINHIAAVFLPVLLGLLWIVDPAMVFGTASVIACGSLALSFLLPRHPAPGRETRFSSGAVPAE